MSDLNRALVVITDYVRERFALEASWVAEMRADGLTVVVTDVHDDDTWCAHDYGTHKHLGVGEGGYVEMMTAWPASWVDINISFWETHFQETELLEDLLPDIPEGIVNDLEDMVITRFRDLETDPEEVLALEFFAYIESLRQASAS